MKNSKTKTAVPKLRFPEFQDTEAWKFKELLKMSNHLVDKVGDAIYPTVSIAAGFGFVTQKERFGRDISGKQYKNYILLKKGDFAYNKGNSKKYPQGCIYELNKFDVVAAPNAFICFRLKKYYIASFYKQYFQANYHAEQLKKYITSGARSDGLLNINQNNFFSIILPSPKKEEQQKIADCLSSIDELITLHSKKLDTLKDYKKGLLQQLFPVEGESIPKLRFPEFENDGEWNQFALGEITSVSAGGTPLSFKSEYWDGNIPWMNSGDLNKKKIFSVLKKITELGLKNSSTKYIPTKCILVGLAGQGKTRGTVAINYIELCTNQSVGAIYPNTQIFVSEFLYYKMDSMYKVLRNISKVEGGRGGLNLQMIKALQIYLPKIKEQQKVADCLTSLDELITAQSKKIETLKQHKKGLLQQLFPSQQEVIR
ncbi:MAG: restriction endonuclease subunit S [Treponema sp. CETP13]|nr:MAG: restriction endonuclease subunit S [Treponema sp. CETP13]